MAAGTLVLLGLSGCFSDPAEVQTDTESGATAMASTTSEPADSGGTTGPDGTTAGPADSGTAADSTGSVATTADTSSDGSGSDTQTVECNECFTGRCDAEGRCERIVFVTQEAYDRNLGAVAGAHDRCGTDAAEAGLEGTFRALLAVNEDADMAFGVLALNAAPNQVFVLNDEQHSVVADSSATLRVHVDVQPDLMRPIDHDAEGNPVEGSSTPCADDDRVWTGLTASGGLAVGGGSCGSWDGSGTNGGTGFFSRVGLDWAAASNCPCDAAATMEPNVAHLYCFEVPDL